MTLRHKLLAILLIALLTLTATTVVVRAQPGDIKVSPGPGSRGVSPGSTVSVSFPDAMDRASVEAALSIDPVAEAGFAWFNNDQHVQLRSREPLAPETTYRVTVDTGVRTVGGRALLTRPYTWSFTTGPDQAQLRFGYNLPIQLVTPSGGRGVTVQPGYTRITLDCTLYAVDAPGLISRYGEIDLSQIPKIDTAGLTAAHAWQSHVDGSDSAARIAIPDGVPAGLYVLDARSPRVGDAQLFLIYSDYALVAKRGRTGRTAWLSHLSDGAPGAGAALTAYDADGAVLATGATDDNGIAHFDGGDVAFIFGETDGQTTLVGLDDNWYSRDYYYGWWGTWPTVPEIAAHIHTDRPIYRPGHTVHYKATLRRFADDGFEVVSASTPVTVTMRDASGNAVSTTNPAIDDYGSLSGDLLLGEDAGLGDWRVEVKTATQTFTGYFQVEEYVKPDYEVAIETDAPYYVRGETAEVTVQADYYFGQPVSDAEVTLRVFRGYYYRGEGTSTQEITGRTDATGAFKASVRLDTSNQYTESFYFEAEVVDASRRPVIAESYVPVHPAEFTLSLRSRRYGVEVGQPVVMTASTVDHDGAPVVGRDVNVEVRQYQRGGYVTARSQSVTTGADGTATATFNDLREGWYSVVATARDDAGNALEQHSYAWLYDYARPWYWWDSQLELTADLDSYAPGETARLLVKSPYTGTALITIERDEVFDEIVTPISGATTIEVPIAADYAPNVWVRVQMWVESEDPYSQTEGRLATAWVSLSVPAEDKRLTVDITPDAETHEPRDEATFTVSVRDSGGRPVEAQLSFALVDEAVLALARDRSGNIFDAFWGNRSNTVATFDSLQAGQGYGRWLEDANRGGQPPAPGAPQPSPDPGQGDEKDEEASQATPRREFPDTAYWDARVVTDANGEAKVTLTLPDSLTTWKAIARAVTRDTRVGQGDGELVVTKAIIADIALPRFAVQGDRFALDVLGRNYVGGELDAACKLEAPGLVQLDAGDKDLTLPFNETRFARWSVVASQIGELPVTARLDTGAGSDAIELPLEIQPFAVPDRFALAGSTESTVDESFEVPFNAVPDDSSVEVRLAPGMALGVLDGLEDLIGYPYGCVEQTMSRMLPNAVIGRLIKVLEIEAPEITEQLPDMMAVGLQKLYGFQNPNGSWGWWHWQHSEGNVYTTAYVLHGLHLTDAAGFEVEPDVITRGLDWLATTLPAEKDPRLQAYGAYVLSLSGRGDPEVAQRLYERRDELDAFALAALAVALDGAGRTSLAEQVLDDLEATAVQTTTTAHWPMNWNDQRWRYYYWYSMANTEKNTAMALDALATLRPGSPLAPKAARWLMENRWGRGWRTTQGTAFAVLGLTDYIIASGELDSEYEWAVWLDGVEVASGEVDRGNVTERIAPLVLTGADLAPGKHTVTLGKQGRGTLFYTLVGRLALYYDGFEPTQAEGLGIDVQRDYHVVTGRGGEGGWAVGDVVNVRLSLTTREELHYVIVEDMLPAGFEALNERLETETDRVPGQEQPWRWYWWGYERKELRDEKVTFFDSYLPPGTHTFDYAARVVTPGVFSARPAEAYTMYRPEVWGRSASARVEVAPDRVQPRPPLAGDFDRDCRLTDFDAALAADAWADGTERDVNGDGRTDAADIATAGGRSGLACGDDVPLPPGAAGDMAVRLAAPGTVEEGRTFELEVVAQGTGNVGAFELTLRLPDGAFEVVDASVDGGLGDPRKLGPVVDGDRVRLGGYAPVGAEATGDTVLVRLTLRALRSGDAEIEVSRAQIVTDDGGEYRVTADGLVVSPEPWTPQATIFLPVAAR